MGMVPFVVVDPLSIFFPLYRTISGNVSYLVTMKTFKIKIVFKGRIFSYPLDSSGRMRLLEISSLEV